MSVDPEMEFAIARLRIEPGDILVVKMRGIASSETFKRVEDHVRRSFGDGLRTLLIDEQIDLAVLSAAEINSRASDVKVDSPELRKHEDEYGSRPPMINDALIKASKLVTDTINEAVKATVFVDEPHEYKGRPEMFEQMRKCIAEGEKLVKVIRATSAGD